MSTITVAEERARGLLLEHLTPVQKRTFRADGYFEFRGKKGSIYRLYTKEALARCGYTGTYNVYRLIEVRQGLTGTQVADQLIGRNIYAIGSRDAGLYSTSCAVPESDTLLAVKIAIEVDERWAEKGCTTGLSRAALGIKKTRRRIRVN